MIHLFRHHDTNIIRGNALTTTSVPATAPSLSPPDNATAKEAMRLAS
jgi:hypothetical protein